MKIDIFMFQKRSIYLNETNYKFDTGKNSEKNDSIIVKRMLYAIN